MFLGSNPVSRVFVDDLDPAGVDGGDAYESFGISREGAIVVVRPDGYVGTIAPLDGPEHIDNYFAGFMKPASTTKA